MNDLKQITSEQKEKKKKTKKKNKNEKKERKYHSAVFGHDAVFIRIISSNVTVYTSREQLVPQNVAICRHYVQINLS